VVCSREPRWSDRGDVDIPETRDVRRPSLNWQCEARNERLMRGDGIKSNIGNVRATWEYSGGA
jgi:hypothetical protein